MQLIWLGAAGFKIDTSEGAALLINPFLSRPPVARPYLSIQLADLVPVDEIFLTDGRFDHASDTPALARQTGAIVHAAEPVCQYLIEQGVTLHTLQSIIPETSKHIGSLSWQVLTRRMNQTDSLVAMHWLTGNLPIPAHRSELVNSGPSGEEVAYHFRSEGLSIVHFSSANWLEAQVHDLQPDLALLPVESHPDTNATTVRLAALMKPKVVIPHHWDDYYPPLSRLADLTRFETALKALAPQIRVYIPTIGQSFDPIRLL